MPEEIIPIKSSTQLFTEIEDITKDVILYSDGSVAMILQTSAVNFGLLSLKEQESIMLSYAGFLNSLSFPIQLLIRTQHKDISQYLELLEKREQKQTNLKLKKSMHDYRLFVASTVKEKDVLDKKFYIVIPFSSIELGLTSKTLWGPQRRGLPFKKSFILERAIMILSPKRDHIIRILQKVGLRATQLTNEQLTKLYFTLYNPEVVMPDSEKQNQTQ